MSDTMTRNSTPKIDAVNSALWALASYNLILGKLVELRQLLQAKNDPDIVAQLDRVLSSYLGVECMKLKPGNLTNTEEDTEITRLLGIKAISEGVAVVNRAGDPMLLELCAYALLLAAFGSFGTSVWTRFVTAVEIR